MGEKSGNGFKEWLEGGQMPVILLHLFECLVVMIIAAVIIALLYLYYGNRDKHLPKDTQTEPKVTPHLPRQPSLDKDIHVDVLATPPASSPGLKVSSLDDGEASTPKGAKTKSKSESNSRIEPKKGVDIEKGVKIEPKKDSSSPTTSKKIDQTGKGSRTSPSTDSQEVKPKTGAQSGTANKNNQANQPATVLTANSDESVETLKLETEDKD